MIFLTTTAIEIDEELLNRCIILTVDESPEQTAAIQSMQRTSRTRDGLRARRKRDAVRTLHQNAQRLIESLEVFNPYAERLTFRHDQTRTRRDHEKYLSLIDAITLLHQHQRERRTEDEGGELVEQVVVSLDDIALANELAHEALGQSLDELPPQTRRLLEELDTMVGAACDAEGIDRCDYRFTRRAVREHIGWGNTQLKVHLKRLEELEYVLVHQGGPGRRMIYELAYDRHAARDGRFLAGLLDVEQLRGEGSGDSDSNRSGSGPNQSGQNSNRSGRGRAEVGGVSGAGRGGANGPQGPLAAPTALNPGFGPPKTRTGWVERPLSTSPVVDVAVSD
jgi:hypothetical protein